jgi:signal transduction histidine kinase
MRRFFSTTLGQIVAIIATSSAVTFGLFLALLWILRPSLPQPPWPWPPAYRIVSLVETLRPLPEYERTRVISAAQRPDMSIGLTLAPALCQTQTSATRDLERVLRSELGNAEPDVTVRSCASGELHKPIQVVIGLGDQMLDVRTGKATSGPPPVLTFPLVGALLFLCVAVAAMSAWAVWRVIGPLRRLSEKADAFGRSISASRIDEQGPLEIRRAARAFNLMQERISRSIQDRTRMLAAISHDLRTPLTRMRLQLETGTVNSARSKLLRDVALMQSMVSSALVFLSGGFEQEEREWLDLGALLSTLCDEYEDGGATVSYQGPEQIRLFCQPNAITRALTNIVENGIHFGSSVIVTASADGDTIRIDVADDGPGIPKERLRDVLEPFVRLDASRSCRSGSVGLGLSIVKEVVEAHTGTLELIQKQPTGLIVRVTLPVEARKSPH